MTDEFSKDFEEESFADLLDAYGSDIAEDLKSGDKVNGRIIHIGADSIFVDTGTKIDGVVEKKELLDENGECPVAVGDTIELYVISSNESELILSKAISGKADAGILINAMETKMPVEGRVREVCKGGFHVDVLGKQAFCPVSQMDVKYIEDPEPYAGQTFQFLVTRVEGDGRNIVISRREYLNIDIEKARDAFFKSSPIDTIFDGVVTKVMPYGAFVELVPGVEGMVHISELGWSRVDDPEKVVKQGDGVQVRVLSIEDGKKPGTHKISLSMKQAGDDPWALVKDSYQEGDTVTGKVRRLVDFGAFVEISPGIEGLVHISEMSYTRRVLRPDELISEGDTVEVMIKEIDPDSKRISLSMRDATGDPWVDIEARFKVGQKVAGELSGKESFGFFVKLEPGVTALLPKSRINRAENPSKLEGVKIGGTIELFIEEIKPGDRKITLTAKGADDGGDWKSYSAKSESSMGSLGDLLQQAMNSDKG